MIKIIKQIQEESDFLIERIVEDNWNDNFKVLFAKRVQDDKFDFFLTLQIQEEHLNLNELENITNELFNKIMHTQKYLGVDKNLSLLMLVEKNTILASDEFNKIVYDFEEDPFYFKKYLLPFTPEQLELLNRILIPSEKIINQLDTIVSDKSLFQMFKENRLHSNTEEFQIYDLVSKIYIKTPFMRLKVNKEELPNISKEIEGKILSEDKNLIEKILTMDSLEPEWEEILELLEVEIDEL